MDVLVLSKIETDYNCKCCGSFLFWSIFFWGIKREDLYFCIERNISVQIMLLSITVTEYATGRG